jgi:hypothetical protein
MTNAPNRPPFDYCPITERAPLTWPGGAKVAVYVGLNVEHFLLDEPSTSIWPGTAELRPDALNYGWRDYGARVGIWRTIEALDRHGIRPSVLLNRQPSTPTRKSCRPAWPEDGRGWRTG